ncbi:hypothetical protein B0T20DRAFT_485021 [Sordaria brevicollis]|uniref:C2H2-type domain-containing protein n=1 Tax=Sordaria brevicollis TaxID=83679 RepID=A0AAE0PMS8_SORBR|nr:hypothetical protein B0T20DRAFT_485021 [Sordaria brevicollis]
MDTWLQQQAIVAQGVARPLDGRPSYQDFYSMRADGQVLHYYHHAALFPERYAPRGGHEFPWYCPVVGCSWEFRIVTELNGHWVYSHRGVTFRDNRNGTFSIWEQQNDRRAYPYVAAVLQTPLGLGAAPFQLPPPSVASNGTVTPGAGHANNNQGNGVADSDDSSEFDPARDSGISMMSFDTTEDEEDEEEDDSDDDLPEETIVIQNALATNPAPAADPAAPSAAAIQAAIVPVTLPIRPPPPNQPSGIFPNPTPRQLEIWPYIISFTLYRLPLPSPSSPANRVLLAFLTRPRIRSLTRSWQLRLRERTPSLGTLTAVALFLGGRADETGSPCQSHCGQYSALVERLFAEQAESAQEDGGPGEWKFEKKFAFPRCIKVPEALEGNQEIEEVLGGRPCCNKLFRELRNAWVTREPMPPRPPGGLVWNGPMW